MTPERLKELIQEGESLEIEFKGEERGPHSDDELVEAAVCLANRSSSAPGWLLVGVEDDGRVTGARPRHESGRTDPLRVVALIANRTRPSLSVRVFLVPWEGNGAGVHFKARFDQSSRGSRAVPARIAASIPVAQGTGEIRPDRALRRFNQRSSIWSAEQIIARTQLRIAREELFANRGIIFGRQL